MKNIFKYTFLSALIGFTACDVDNELPEITDPNASTETVALNVNGVDFSKYVAVGASFTAGFTDGALFIKAQENSFPNILANKFKMANGGDFVQPLMSDNHGGFVSGGAVVQAPRFYFNGSGPTVVSDTPTTILGVPAAGAPNFNNYGIPGAKSFHLTAAGYGNAAGLAIGAANPYFVRMASAPNASVIGDAAAQQPTFFTLSEIGGNDVLGYALSGGSGEDQTGNLDPSTYGGNDITDPTVFGSVFSGLVDVLTANGAKGVVANVPYITSLAHFTTVPHNPLDPSTNADLAGQIPLLNTVYGAVNQVYEAAGEPERKIEFSTDMANPVVVIDESLTNLTVSIAQGLQASPTFVPFVESLGLPGAAAPLVAQLLGSHYGKARPASEDDLLVLPSSSVIGTVNATMMQSLMTQGIPQELAAQFSAEGVTLPLEDKWVITPDEQMAIKTATDAYNTTIKAVADAKGLAFVDFKEILANAATTGYSFDNYTLTTSLVSGGLISLDGVHLTGRGYAVMANEILKAIDTTYGSNFGVATDGLAKADDHPTNYSSIILPD